MPLLTDVLRQGQSDRNRPMQEIVHGVIIGPDGGAFQIVVGGISYRAQSGISADLTAGDRVWVVIGRGAPKIIGLFGKDENIP
jgi:hypothetical protein